jgi:hypothetical protein
MSWYRIAALDIKAKAVDVERACFVRGEIDWRVARAKSIISEEPNIHIYFRQVLLQSLLFKIDRSRPNHVTGRELLTKHEDM